MQRVPLIPELQLYLAGQIMPLWQELQRESGTEETPPPYWAFAWVGGQAVARYLLDHPEVVAGKSVLDFGAGSGLCGIAAMKSGAASVLAADIDPLAQAAIMLNAEVNAVNVSVTGDNLLRSDPPKVHVILLGDMCYERTLSQQVFRWLAAARAGRSHVLLGDPGRPYFQRCNPELLAQVAQYEVSTTLDLENSTVKTVGVFRLAKDCEA